MTQYLQNGLKDFKNILHTNSLYGTRMYSDNFGFDLKKLHFFQKFSLL